MISGPVAQGHQKFFRSISFLFVILYELRAYITFANVIKPLMELCSAKAPWGKIFGGGRLQPRRPRFHSEHGSATGN